MTMKPRALMCLPLLLLIACAPAMADTAPGRLDTAPASAAASGDVQSVLFIGNSFTFGANSPVRVYRANTVTDLNGDGVGGVPALFQLLTEEAGLHYRTSLETSPGRTLQWHWQNRRERVDRSWDHVVMQEYSTLDPQHPGDPAKLIDYAGRFARQFKARNPDADISLTATWSRPDQVYRSNGPWRGQPIDRMAIDLRRGYDAAEAANPQIARVNPVGQAFNCAIAAGYADPDPYDGIAYGKIDLWSFDHYHASAAGYYLEALIVFGKITGQDPRDFGRDERGANELGLSPDQATQLQRAAWATLKGGDCSQLPDQSARG